MLKLIMEHKAYPMESRNSNKLSKALAHWALNTLIALFALLPFQAKAQSCIGVAHLWILNDESSSASFNDS